MIPSYYTDYSLAGWEVDSGSYSTGTFDYSLRPGVRSEETRSIRVSLRISFPLQEEVEEEGRSLYLPHTHVYTPF